MNSPKISIIVPVYQVEKYLKKCVYSIQNQTYPNIEIILVDDGSTDGCSEICDELAKLDTRIVVIHKKNGGLSDARNVGLEIATGDYIGFVDSDDFLDPKMYEILVKCMKKDEADISVCDYVRVNEFGNRVDNKIQPTIQNRCFSREEFIEELLKPYGGKFVVTWNKLYKKAIFKIIRFPFGKQHEDEFVIHRIIAQSSKISYVNNQLYYYLQRKGSIMDTGFSVKSMDYGEALIDRYYFTKKEGFTNWKKHTALRLSYELEKWEALSNNDKEIQKRFEELRKKARFLFFEKAAWQEYSFGVRCYLKFNLIAPKLAKKMRKILKICIRLFRRK